MERPARNLRMRRRWCDLLLTRRFLTRWLNYGRCYRVLNFCVDDGDTTQFMVEWAGKRDITLRVDVVTNENLKQGTGSRKNFGFSEVHYHTGDPFCDAPGDEYDLVICSLALHSYQKEDAVRLLIRLR